MTCASRKYRDEFETIILRHQNSNIRPYGLNRFVSLCRDRSQVLRDPGQRDRAIGPAPDYPKLAVRSERNRLFHCAQSAGCRVMGISYLCIWLDAEFY